jgi:hypothetical protein
MVNVFLHMFDQSNFGSAETLIRKPPRRVSSFLPGTPSPKTSCHPQASPPSLCIICFDREHVCTHFSSRRPGCRRRVHLTMRACIPHIRGLFHISSPPPYFVTYGTVINLTSALTTWSYNFYFLFFIMPTIKIPSSLCLFSSERTPCFSLHFMNSSLRL